MTKFGAHACTDITGFSFIGHALEMATASQVGMVVQSKAVPILSGAMEYAKLGLIPGGASSNRNFFSCRVDVDSSVPPLLVDLFYDPQTSGGLLISLPSGEAEELVATLKKERDMDSYIVGKVMKEPVGKIQIL
jgi:selenide,water dikinase